MNKLTDASYTLNLLIDLLRNSAGFDLRAQIFHADESEVANRPGLFVEFSGPDAPLLTSRNGELLFAIEHIAAKMLHLEPEEHDRISFDADGFKALRDRALLRLAEVAVIKVRTTATAYVFPPMSPRERRILHLALASSGLKSASSGELSGRSVVLYPEGVLPPSG
jgi:spoIIIJ-associated protein